MLPNNRILILLRNEDVLRYFRDVLFGEGGYSVVTESDAHAGFSLIKQEAFDLVIAGVDLPGFEGFAAVHELKAIDPSCVVLVYADELRYDFMEQAQSLGVYDFITKPFSIKELKSRVKAVLRRSTQDTPKDSDNIILRYKGVELNTEQYSLSVDGEDIKLTKTEFNILVLFMENPGKIFSRDNIIDSVRGHDVFVVDRTIDVHIMNLRKKLGEYKNIITTFSGVGYGFKE